MKNIVLIQCDSMDGRLPGYMGHPAMRAATPNIDRLAAEGSVFENAYCNSPLCCPSRASLWSGQQIFGCRAWNNYEGLSPEQPTFADMLQTAGYQTAVIGKTDYLCGHHTVRSRVSSWTGAANARLKRPNFNERYYPKIYQDGREQVHELHWQYTQQAVDQLELLSKNEKPFFLYLGINSPHPPFITSNRYIDQVDQGAVDIPPHDVEKHPVIEYQRICKNWNFGFDADTVRLVRTVYFAMIAEVDAMVAAVLEQMKKLGIDENTVVIFLSDHGEMAMEHDLYYKSNMYEASVRIPMIWKGPGIRAGARLKQPVSLVDVFPTLADIACQPADPQLHGHSLLPELRGEKSDRPDFIFCEYHGENSCASMYMVRANQYKYVKYSDGYRAQLFDLENDPDELNNLEGSGLKAEALLRRLLEQIVDTDAVSETVAQYNRESFAAWRREQIENGTYQEQMSRIFSGFDELLEDDIIPWTPEDEQLLCACLALGQEEQR